MPVTEKTLEQKLDKEILSIIKKSGFDKEFLATLHSLTYSDFLSNKMLMMWMIREGIPYSLFDLIQHYTLFSDSYWSTLLDLSTKTLNRYKEESRQFKPIQSEKIIEVAEVTNVGVDVFGSMDKFKLWLDTPNFALGNTKPIELLSDSYGKEMVIAELTRINYGILS